MPLAELLCVVLFPDGDTHTFHVNVRLSLSSTQIQIRCVFVPKVLIICIFLSLQKQQDGSVLFNAVCTQLDVQDTHNYSLLISENTLRETSPVRSLWIVQHCMHLSQWGQQCAWTCVYVLCAVCLCLYLVCTYSMHVSSLCVFYMCDVCCLWLCGVCSPQRWLELNKPMKKQLKGEQQLFFSARPSCRSSAPGMPYPKLTHQLNNLIIWRPPEASGRLAEKISPHGMSCPQKAELSHSVSLRCS